MIYEWKTITHKFTIAGKTECYLTVGFVEQSHLEMYKHLLIGDICYLDITVNKKDDELRVYEVLFGVITEFIRQGGHIKHAIDVMMFQNMHPKGVTSNEEIPMCKSIVDYVAKYLAALNERKKNASKEC